MTQAMKDYLAPLGFKAKDKITGFEGVVTSVCFDLYGCVQLAIGPSTLDSKGELIAGQWFDHKRLDILGKKPVMDAPNFGFGPGSEAGPAPKPAHRSMPVR